ncbi:MAG: type II toxin-antitoxin system RelB/DinJ family antitoxin [Bacilli bacterium]|nr:type II toxin-antitoxin system RelB/DinJ family antitoxin [Bacilli bacterium]
MGNKITLTMKIDKELKKEVSTIFKNLGLDMTTATTIFFKQVLRCNRLPFEVKLDVPNQETLKTIDDSRNKKNLSEEFTSIDNLMKTLND